MANELRKMAKAARESARAYEKERAERTFHGVFSWNERSRYHAEDAHQIFKSEVRAQAEADAMNAADTKSGGNEFVVRTVTDDHGEVCRQARLAPDAKRACKKRGS